MIYVTVLGLLVLAQVGVVALFIVRQSDVKKFLEDRWNNDLDNHQKWQIQEIFECGVVADEEHYWNLNGDSTWSSGTGGDSEYVNYLGSFYDYEDEEGSETVNADGKR